MKARKSRLGRIGANGFVAAMIALAAYLFVAYLVMPLFWREHQEGVHPSLATVPKVTQNKDGIPGDPVNVGLIGSEQEIVGAMLAVGWQPADPLTFQSSLEIITSVGLKQPDPDAPVSNLYLFGRKQDLAFELEVGASASQRHHVRWWQTGDVDAQGRAIWIGAATFDTRSGFSHLTGQVTHHIAPDVDTERDLLMAELEKAGQIQPPYQVMGVGPTQSGRNAGGDPYVTDGMVSIGILAPPPPAQGDPGTKQN